MTLIYKVNRLLILQANISNCSNLLFVLYLLIYEFVPRTLRYIGRENQPPQNVRLLSDSESDWI